MNGLHHEGPRPGLVARILGERYVLFALAGLSLALIVLAKADIKLLTYASDRGGDLLRPVAVAVVQPLAAIRGGAERLGGALALDQENERLRQEIRRLEAWEGEALRLQVQNDSLRRMLAMPREMAAPRITTARIVADTGGPFMQTRLIDVGLDGGVAKGMAISDGRGLIGRVIEVGQGSARVLLVTDFNSRIPVIADRSRDQAVVEGDNSGLLAMRFLPMNPDLKVGDKILTSGRGGVLPPGLPVGEIVHIDDKRMLVRPFADWERLDYVSVLQTAPVPTLDGTLPTEERLSRAVMPPTLP